MGAHEEACDGGHRGGCFGDGDERGGAVADTASVFVEGEPWGSTESGAGQVTVPDMVNKNVFEAGAALATIKLKYKVVKVPSATVAKALVISQNPAAGTVVPLGTEIELTASTGPDVGSSHAECVDRRLVLPGGCRSGSVPFRTFRASLPQETMDPHDRSLLEPAVARRWRGPGPGDADKPLTIPGGILRMHRLRLRWVIPFALAAIGMCVIAPSANAAVNTDNGCKASTDARR